MAASFSKDPLLLKAFTEGFDLHSYLATQSFKIVFKQDVLISNEDSYIIVDGVKYNVKKELRQDHKNCLFSKVYLGGKDRAYEYLSKYIMTHNSPETGMLVADKVSKNIEHQLPVLMKWCYSQGDFVRKHGYSVMSKTGRRRYFDDTEKYIDGEASNAPIQGTAGDMMKMALVRINNLIEDKAKEFNVPETEIGWLTFSIYDQTLTCINDKYLFLKDDIKKIMADSLTFYLDGLIGDSGCEIIKQWQK